MKHEFAAVLIELDDRFTPAEIGVQMVEPYGHVHRGHCRNKPSRIHKQHGKPPLLSGRRFSRVTVIPSTLGRFLYLKKMLVEVRWRRASAGNNLILFKQRNLTLNANNLAFHSGKD